MRIRIRRAVVGIVDGVSLSHLFPGVSYEVSDSLGAYLISNGAADELGASAAIVDPTDDSSESPVFGGVMVTKPLERAADKPPSQSALRRRKRAPRR